MSYTRRIQGETEPGRGSSSDIEEDYFIVCKTVTAEEFKMASKRLAEEIVRTRGKPIGFQKLF